MIGASFVSLTFMFSDEAMGCTVVLRRHSGPTTLQLKLNDLAKVISTIGSIAGVLTSL